MILSQNTNEYETVVPYLFSLYKTKGHQMKLAVKVLKANKGEMFLTYCLIKMWSFFLQDVVDAKSLRVMLSRKKNN